MRELFANESRANKLANANATKLEAHAGNASKLASANATKLDDVDGSTADVKMKENKGGGLVFAKKEKKHTKTKDKKIKGGGKIPTFPQGGGA